MIGGIHPMMMTPVESRSTWNPLDKGAGVVLSNGNLTGTGPAAAANSNTRATQPRTSGLLYFEVKQGGAGGLFVGLATGATANSSYPGADTNSIAYGANGGIYYNGGATGTVVAFALNDVLGVAANLTTRFVWFLKNGVAIQGNPAAGTGGSALPAGALFPAIYLYDATYVGTANFGAAAFAYSPPSGFSAWG